MIKKLNKHRVRRQNMTITAKYTTNWYELRFAIANTKSISELRIW